MALPIKSNNTQQGCNPISSNCVIWQGPDIPCINLCTGDSVSDVVAKMATELCEITDQLNISLLDLSCFNPLSPTPQNFRDVTQIIINKICALENIIPDNVQGTSGCPSDCEVSVAPCLQYTDNLGNNVISLPIKDYVILIGNRICTILTSIANLQTQINSLDVRVTNLENNRTDGSSSTFNVTSQCLSASSVSLQEYINLLDAAFCELQTLSGTTPQYISASSVAQCVTTNSIQMANPPSLIGSYPLWIPSPETAFQQIQNLWVAICDIRTGITNIQTQLETCCAPDPVCPTNLPRATFELNKINPTNDLFFTVNAIGPLSPNGNVLINGEEWKLVRFEGSITASANNTVTLINQPIPNTAFTTNINYTGAENPFYQLPGISSSLAVTVTGTFYWENVATGQECTTTPVNNGQAISNQLIASCPVLWSSPQADITYTPNPVITCNPVTGSSVNISLVPAPGFPVINGAGVTNAFLTGTVQYTNTLGALVTNSVVISTASPSISVTGIDCSSNLTLTITGVNQNGVTRTCNVTDTISIPASVTP